MKLNRLSYSISEACALTSLGRTTLYAAIKRGDLKTQKIGRRTVITSKHLLDFLEALPVVTPPTAVMPLRGDDRQ
jgi:excisionase family DNA binding protein